VLFHSVIIDSVHVYLLSWRGDAQGHTGHSGIQTTDLVGCNDTMFLSSFRLDVPLLYASVRRGNGVHLDDRSVVWQLEGWFESLV